MSTPIGNRSVTDISTAAGEAESTLRLLAGLPAPEGLEMRVKSSLRNAPKQSASLFEWPLNFSRGWTESAWIKGAAAAAIVCVVAGGGWRVYSHVQPQSSLLAAPRAGGFSSAGAVRTPHTLDGPILTRPQAPVSSEKRDAKKKPPVGKTATPSVRQ